MAEWWDGLTEKQKKFCEAYSSNGGNAFKAAESAGYQIPNPQAYQVLDSLSVKRALEELRKIDTKAAIAAREERQAFWTETMRSQDQTMRDRLKASELLGKSHADFIERKEISGPNQGPISVDLTGLSDEQLRAIAGL